MEENQNGITALITAFSRAYHASHDSPKIFDDFLAPRLYTAEETATFSRQLAELVKIVDPEYAAANPSPEEALARVMQRHNGPVTLSRSRCAEDALEDALLHGVHQYVILGAGLDTFAFRRPDLTGRLEVFEIDHPVTQKMKRERLVMLGMDTPPNLHLVPIDFTSDNLADVLHSAGYDPHLLTFFSWLGVTYYLTRAVVFANLEAIAALAPSGSQIVFDYMDADAFDPEKASPRTRLMQEIARQVGEPMKFGIHPRELEDQLAGVGLRIVENLDPAELEARCFQGRSDEYHAFPHIHFARAAVK